MNKYTKLLSAKDYDSEQWKNYEEECKSFILKFRDAIIAALDCPPENVKWIRYAKAENTPGLYDDWDEFIGAKLRYFPLHRSMALFENGFWGFTFGIELDGTLLRLRFKVKKVDKVYQLHHEEEYTVSNDSMLQHIAEIVTNNAIRFYENRFQEFMKGRDGSLGFKIESKN